MDVRKETYVELPLFEYTENSRKGAKKTPFIKTLEFFFESYRWEILLGAVFALLLIFLWVYAPPRLNGEVSIAPRSPGRPFYNFRWGRDFISINYHKLWSWGSILLSAVLLLLTVWVARKRWLLGAQFILLAASMNLAILGQWLLPIFDLGVWGRNLYFLAIYGFMMWAWVTRSRLCVEEKPKKPIKKSVEIIFLLVLILLTASARLYHLHTIPYGIEGDEAKWTSEAVNLGILGIPDSSGEYHRDALPVSYYLQVPLHRLVGPSLFAARLTVVILSIIGTLLFYWLLRQITILPLAMLASALLSVSIFDISASRLANVESFVKIPPILTLALLAWAVRSRRWQIYGISGIALALGMLTYDTVFPLLIVVLIIVLIELTRQKENLLEKSKAVGALLAPTILSLPLLIPYLSSRFSYYEFGERGLGTETAATLWTYFSRVVSSWFVASHPDFLYNRSGPLLNAILMPFLVLGLVIAFFHIKKKAIYWMMLWGALIIFPIPILANSPVGRVYYPALPAVYFFVGLGIFYFWTELDRLLGKNLRPLLFTATLLPLVWLPLSNFYIYFNEIEDSFDRQMRREIGELAGQMAGEETLILIPSVPNTDTALNNEYQMLELYMLQKIPAEKLDSAYEYVAPENLATEIFLQKDAYQNIEILIDTGNTPDVLDTLQSCYPDGETMQGHFFTRFTLSENDLAESGCISATLNLEVQGYNALFWELKNIKTEEILINCQSHSERLIFLEAEDFPMSHGWQTERRYAPDWSGTGFVMDNMDSAAFSFGKNLSDFEEGYIWIRYYQRVTEDAPSYLNVGEESYPFANPDADDLHLWRWERVGPVKFNDETELSISHEGDAPYFMAIFIDSIAITEDAQFSPENNLWESTDVFSFSYDSPQSSGLLNLELSNNAYQCQAVVETGLPIIEVGGENVLSSDIVELEIR